MSDELIPREIVEQSANSDVSDLDERSRNLEKETGVPIPELLHSLPKVTPELANTLVREHPVTPVVYEDEYEYLNAREGLSFCRAYGVSAQEALDNFYAIVSVENPIELFEAFNSPRAGEVQRIMQSEEVRRNKRDVDVLTTELALLAFEGHKGIEIGNIDDYIAWVMERY
jgi:hypothetical protein